MTEVQTCSSITVVLVVVCTDYVYDAFILAFSYRALVHCPMVDHGSGQIAQFVGLNRIQILSNFIADCYCFTRKAMLELNRSSSKLGQEYGIQNAPSGNRIY